MKDIKGLVYAGEVFEVMETHNRQAPGLVLQCRNTETSARKTMLRQWVRKIPPLEILAEQAE